MKSFMRIFTVLVLFTIFWGLHAPELISSSEVDNDRFPNVTPPKWETGQSANYQIKVSNVPDFEEEFIINLRLAITGTRDVKDTEFYWLEIDVIDVNGVSPAAIGIPSIRFKVLTKYIPFSYIQDNTEEFLQDFVSGNFINEIVLDLYDGDPQFMNFPTIKLFLEGMFDKDLKTLIAEKISPYSEFEAITDKLNIESGKETVDTIAGEFFDASFVKVWQKIEKTKVDFRIYSHSKIPILGMAKTEIGIQDGNSDEIVNLSIELTDYDMSGAESWIIGIPRPLDPLQLLEGFSAASSGSQFELTDWKWVNKPSINSIKIQGVVVNNSSESYTNIKVIITVRDDNGKFLGSAFTYLEPSVVGPGKEAAFTAYIEDAQCETSSLSISCEFEV